MLVDDARVSRRHLVIEPEAPGWRIRDVSANGSWYNGVRIEPNGLLLNPTGTIRVLLGDPAGPEVVFTYQAPVAAPPAPTGATGATRPAFGPGHDAAPARRAAGVRSGPDGGGSAA